MRERYIVRTLKRMIFIAMAATILFVQEQLLTMLPNVQLTVLLLVLFSSVLTFRETMTVIFVHVILDSLFMGAFYPFYMVPMFIGWSLVPIAYHTVLRRTNNELKLAAFGFVHGFLYGWTFIPFVMIQTGIYQFWPYLMADLLFEIIMGVSSFITILWLFKPLYRIVSRELNKTDQHWRIVQKKH